MTRGEAEQLASELLRTTALSWRQIGAELKPVAEREMGRRKHPTISDVERGLAVVIRDRTDGCRLPAPEWLCLWLAGRGVVPPPQSPGAS